MGKMVGERFHPTDEELTSYYLSNKILGKDWLVQDAINEINICNFDPWDLPQQSKIQSSDQVWYFFSPKDNKYLNSKRTNRTTKSGFWKATGVDRKIRGKRSNRDIIGAKKTLVFYKGRVPKGERTSWVMHEYHLTVIPDNQRTYVVCKIKDKSGEYKGIPSCNGNVPSPSLASDSNHFAGINPEIEGGQPSLQTPESFLGLSDYELAVQLNEQEGISISELQFTNEFGSDPYSNTQQPIIQLTDGDHMFLDQSECEDLSFLEDFLVDPDIVYHEKSLHEHCNEYRPPKSLAGVYFDYSSDGDTETVSAVVLQTNGGSSGTNESSASTTVSKSENHPKNPTIVLQEHPRRIRLQSKTTQTAASKDKGKAGIVEPVSAVGPHKNKKSSIQESEKEEKKGSFCFLKTIDSSPEPNLPYIYLINVIIGLILFVIILREIMFVH